MFLVLQGCMTVSYGRNLGFLISREIFHLLDFLCMETCVGYITYQVTIITKYPYIFSLVHFGSLGYSFYIRLGYFCNLSSEKAILMALLCLLYLLAHGIVLIKE